MRTVERVTSRMQVVSPKQHVITPKYTRCNWSHDHLSPVARRNISIVVGERPLRDGIGLHCKRSMVGWAADCMLRSSHSLCQCQFLTFQQMHRYVEPFIRQKRMVVAGFYWWSVDDVKIQPMSMNYDHSMVYAQQGVFRRFIQANLSFTKYHRPNWSYGIGQVPTFDVADTGLKLKGRYWVTSDVQQRYTNYLCQWSLWSCLSNQENLKTRISPPPNVKQTLVNSVRYGSKRHVPDWVLSCAGVCKLLPVRSFHSDREVWWCKRIR